MKKTFSLAALLTFLFCAPLWSQSDPGSNNLVEDLEKAKKKVLTESYSLRYKLQVGETLRYQVEHLASVDTKIQGNRQTSKSRSVSTKSWRVQKVDADGSIHFVHSIDAVDMWSQVNGRQPVRYNSRTDQEPPAEYQVVAETVGKPLSIIQMDPHGKILQRKDNIPQFQLGVGGLVVPLPSQPVKLGASWSVPSTVRVRRKDGSVKVIKTRQKYELQDVKAGVATISIDTQVLTPVNDARIRSQLVQRLTSGQIKFDVDAGRTLSKEMDWDEVVIGFNGPKSNMKYRAQFTEKLLSDGVKTARKP